MKIENLTDLENLATINAHKHGWIVYWIKQFATKEHDLTIGDAIALTHSELSEALEDYRNDNKTHFGEEMADVVIRVLHICGDLGIDLTKEINDKMVKNQSRPVNHGRKNL